MLHHGKQHFFRHFGQTEEIRKILSYAIFKDSN